MSMVLKMKIPFLNSLGVDEVIVYILLFLVINPISYARISPVVVMIATLIWFLSAYNASPGNMGKCITSPLFINICIYPILLVIYSIRSDIRFEKKSIADCVIVLMMLYYMGKNKEKLHKFIVGYLVIISGYSIIVLLRNPMISRIMAGESAKYGNFLTGGYNTVYGLVFLSVAILGLIVNDKYRNHRNSLIFMLFATFIVLSQYVTALILLVLGSVLIFCGRNRFWKTFFVMCFVIGITLLILFPDFIVSLLFSISKWFPEGTFQRYRIQQLGELIVNFRQGIVSSTTTEGSVVRVDLYKITFDTIKSNFLWGVGNVSKKLTGGHATFLDVIAEYGVICGGVFIFTRVCLFFQILKFVPEQYKYCYRIIGFLFILLSIINTTNDMGISVIIYLEIPYLFLVSNETEKNLVDGKCMPLRKMRDKYV